MRVLTVCSGNSSPGRGFDFDRDQPFVAEQVREIEKLGVEEDLFFIKGKGVGGYLSNVRPLRRHLADGEYDVVHAHFGFSGLVGVLQTAAPVVVTFHGCDVNVPRNNVISSFASVRADWRIFVSEALHAKMFLRPRDAFSIVPCGVDVNTFSPMPWAEARRRRGLDPDRKYVLFASSFSAPAKNYPLARAAVARLGGDVELLELSGYSRREVAELMNACDLLLMTSHREGSPQVVKEALACNCPVVSTDVGDVRDLLRGVNGCHVTSHEVVDVADSVADVLASGDRPAGRDRVVPISGANVAGRVIDIYEQVLRGKRVLSGRLGRSQPTDGPIEGAPRRTGVRSSATSGRGVA